MYTILRHFAEGIADLRAGKDPSGVTDVQVGVCLEKLLWLFALYHLSRETGDFLELGLLLPEEVQGVRNEVYALLAEVRVDAVGLCDSWDWLDFELKSTLGRYDGQVYEALLKSAKQEPLNLMDPVEGFNRHWRPFYKVQESQQQARL
jgi:acyl-CoA oxidase